MMVSSRYFFEVGQLLLVTLFGHIFPVKLPCILIDMVLVEHHSPSVIDIKSLWEFNIRILNTKKKT